VDIDEEYKYLGVQIWTIRWTGLKTQRLCTRKVRVICIFYEDSDLSTSAKPCCRCSHSVVVSVIFYAVVCWGSRVKAADDNRVIQEHLQP